MRPDGKPPDPPGSSPPLGSFATALIAALALRVRLLPEVIDVSIILTFSGLGALSFTLYGALRRFDPERVARLGFFLLVVLLEVV